MILQGRFIGRFLHHRDISSQRQEIHHSVFLTGQTLNFDGLLFSLNPLFEVFFEIGQKNLFQGQAQQMYISQRLPKVVFVSVTQILPFSVTIHLLLHLIFSTCFYKVMSSSAEPTAFQPIMSAPTKVHTNNSPISRRASNASHTSHKETRDPKLDVNLPYRTLSAAANLDEYTVEKPEGEIPGRLEPDGKTRYNLVTFTPNDPDNPKNWSKVGYE